jgi:hypothetical protein
MLWKLIKQLRVTFDAGEVPSDVTLLKSSRSTGTGGVGQPLSDVELLIVQGGKIIYDYVKEGVKVPKDNIPPLSFYMDAYLEIKDLTHDGIPEVLIPFRF